jgi:transposase
MAKPLVDDALWAEIEPLLPQPKPRRFRFPGRKPIDNRKALTGILFVLKTGIPWEDLPQEMGCGCGMTCWNKLHEWHEAGVWQRLHERLLARLRHADRLDWSRAVVDSASVRAIHGGEATGPNPTDRAKAGTKHHVISDARGLPLATILTGANTHDVTQLKPLVRKVPPVRGKPGRPRQRPDCVQGDRAYDSEPDREWLREQGIQPLLARRGTPHGSGLGVYRWVVERLLSWLHQSRRLRVRDERRVEIHEAFLTLASAMICWVALITSLF